MAVQVSYPGVYIDEFAPAAPIQGVSTSIAAFLGANAYGTPNKPTLITSWDAYQKEFAPKPPIPPEDDDYLYYAVRGFFANGGQLCFVTAVSNGMPAWLVLQDDQPAGSEADAVKITGRKTGNPSPAIRVKSVAANVVKTVNLYEPKVNIVGNLAQGARSIKVASAAGAARFLAGDRIVVANAAGSEPAIVSRTSGDVVYLNAPLNNGYNGPNPLQLAPLDAFATSFRVDGAAGPTGPAGLVPGSIVTITQDPGGGAALRKHVTVTTAVRAERISAALTTYRVSIKEGSADFVLYDTNPIKIVSEEFTLTVKQGTSELEYPSLSMCALHPRYFANVINTNENGLVIAQPVEPPSGAPLDLSRPIQTNFASLGNGTNHNAALIAGRIDDYEKALEKLAPINDVSIVAVPDRTDGALQRAVLDWCFLLHDRFAIFDSIRGTDPENIPDQAASLEQNKGFGALYYPWIEVASAKTGSSILVPPSGHIAGIYARTDISRGVFKAPAGNDCTIAGAIGVERMLSDSEQGFVNLKGVNVIRVFRRGGRPIVWGARTTSTDTNWQYVNIRRLFLFLEESIQTGIRGAVFEPNNQALWHKLKRTITAFLTQQWRDGALFGEKPEQAFYVRIDEALNPDKERALGRLYIEIGVRPSYPAEFIIVRIGIWQGGSEVSEG